MGYGNDSESLGYIKKLKEMLADLNTIESGLFNIVKQIRVQSPRFGIISDEEILQLAYMMYNPKVKLIFITIRNFAIH